MTAWLVAAAATALCVALRLRLRARAALVAQAVHELRGPLCAAQLALEGALDGRVEPRHAAAIDLQLRRAALALEDLGAAGRGERAPELLEAVDAGELLRDSVAAWRPLARAAGGDVRLEAPAIRARVLADRLRLAQAAGNLVVNAIEHGGGRVRVRLRTTGASVRIEVADDGPGLPAPVPELLRAARGGRGRRGHGLAVAARVAAVHGGTLGTAPSSRGARLVLELPALPAEHAARSETEP